MWHGLFHQDVIMNVDVVKEEKIQIGKTYIIVTQWSTELPELFVNYNKPTVIYRPTDP